MNRSIRSSLGRSLVLVLGAVGCNAILDNQPGRLEETNRPTDVSPTQPGGGSRQAPVQVPSTVTPPTDASTPPTRGGACAPGQKACHGLCVALTDPLYGCGDPTCTPCATPHGAPGCKANVCVVQACDVGYSDCNAVAGDGCEVDLASAATCGSCNGLCPPSSPVCAPGAAGSLCTSGCPMEAPTLCGNQCSSLNTIQHCGACDARCPEVDQAMSECRAGQCTFTCRPGYRACGGSCVLSTDPKACGPSCVVCPVPVNAEASCQADSCAFQCKPDFGDCNKVATDGCESLLKSDPLNCGACGRSCSGAPCNDGVCGTPGDAGGQ